MSVPELNIEEQVQNILNNILDQLRLLYQQFMENDVNHMQIYSKIDGLKSVVEDSKYKLGEYIIKVKEGIETASLYLDILNYIEKVSQNLSAVSYRYTVLQSKIKIEDKIIQSLLISMIEKLIAATSNALESFRLLSLNTRKSAEKARNIIKIEEEVDDLYRNFELKLFEKESELAFMMLTKDIGDRLEDCADLLRDTANNILYISYLRE
ncbi:DUF47 family protein [Sulfurisphaera ohwakuensis]|uniref:DUF47 family protein n=1 Tax=Sulfurisphaera ohwakuensis TaxID=69656 RepID=A0A650CDZ6_SULOH|nr:DUF47 family protein [Sulfurisphaera ohwakuensis]MBB5253074.1 uncharacterized protein Yka (UPF0111/DUF47 family) [Sulfurisphaera ohwakuensis]QGR16002.1 DUF47 family protein [Sulfurisphaera ohwakuensis]